MKPFVVATSSILLVAIALGGCSSFVVKCQSDFLPPNAADWLNPLTLITAQQQLQTVLGHLPEQQIRAAWKNLEHTRDFQVSESQLSDEGRYTITRQIVRPYRFREIVNSETGSSIKTIIGDQNYYCYEPEVIPCAGIYLPLSFPFVGVYTGDFGRSIANGEHPITHAKQIGQATVNGVDLCIYDYEHEGSAAILSIGKRQETYHSGQTLEGVTSVVRLWVNAATGLPYREDVTVTYANLIPPLVMQRVLRYSYATDITIEPPFNTVN